MSPFVRILLWSVAAGFAGVLLFFLAPLVAQAILPRERAESVSDRYFDWAMAMGQRVALFRRKHGGYSLVPTEFDSDIQMEELELDGRTGHITDTANFTGRCFRQKFALLTEKRNAVITPLVAEVGEFRDKLAADGALEFVVQTNQANAMTDGGYMEAVARDTEIPSATRLVDPAHAVSVLPGNAGPFLASVAEEFTAKSQREFMSRQTAEYLLILMAFGLGFALVWFAFSQGGAGGGGSIVRVPATVGVFGAW